MSRIIQATLEAVWDRTEAVRWARTLNRWPARRFRIEKSRCGSSRLVSAEKAHRLQKRYGGVVVEVIPPPVRKRFPNQFDALGALMDTCPHCGVEEGLACRAPRGVKVRPHRVRKAA